MRVTGLHAAIVLICIAIAIVLAGFGFALYRWAH